MKMMKKISVIITTLLAFAIVMPATAYAVDDEIMYGTIVAIDAENGQITMQDSEGNEYTVDIGGSDMELGGQGIGISELEVGQSVGTYGQVTGDSAVSLTLTVIPESPTYRHMTGVVAEVDQDGISLQNEDGQFAMSVNGANMQVGDAVTTIIEVPVGVDPDEYIQDVQQGVGVARAQITSFESFSETVAGIGANLSNMGGDSGIAPDEVAVQIVNQLGTMTQNASEETRLRLQETMNQALGESMPPEAWSGMSQAAAQGIQSNGAGFIPPDAFGQMNADAFSQISPDAVAQMQPQAFGELSQEAMAQMSSEAAGSIDPTAREFMSTENLPPGWSIAPDGFPCPPGAPCNTGEGGTSTMPSEPPTMPMPTDTPPEEPGDGTTPPTMPTTLPTEPPDGEEPPDPTEPMPTEPTDVPDPTDPAPTMPTAPEPPPEEPSAPPAPPAPPSPPTGP